MNSDFELNSSILSSANTSETDLTLTEPLTIDVNKGHSKYVSHYGDVDLDSLHIAPNANFCCNDVNSETQVAVYEELCRISEKLKQEAKRQKEFEETILRRAKVVEQREEELNCFSVQLTEKEKRVVNFEASLYEVKHNFDSSVHEKISVAVNLCKRQMESNISQLEKELREKNAEIKRLQGSFNMLKDTCDRQKGKITDLESKNSQVQTQLTSANGRLKNLLRQQKTSSQVVTKSFSGTKPKAKLVSRATHCDLIQNKVTKTSKFTSAEILTRQFDWINKIQFEAYKDTTLPSLEEIISKSNHLMSITVKSLILSDSNLNPVLSADLECSILQFVYWILYFSEKSETSSSYPSSLLRNFSEVIFKSMDSKAEDQVTSINPEKLCSSEEPKNRLLSVLVLMKTCNDTYRLIKSAAQLKKELNLTESKSLFAQIRGASHISFLLNTHKPAEFSALLDVFVQLSLDSNLEPNEALPSSLDNLISEKLSKLLQDSNPESQLLEKLMVVLQRICKVRPQKKLFEQKNLIPHLQQLWLKSNSDNAFLALSVRSVLSSVGASIPILK